MRWLIVNLYVFFVTFPDRFYPFACKANGQWVRGRRSYERAVARALKKHGVGRIGYKLTLYREVFHFVGSILFIVGATVISQNFFGSDAALYFLLYAAIVALTFQEFYLHPKQYSQHFRKGILDWFVWVVPMLIYIFR
ncbi:hypothetical protein H7X87_00250 [Acetobacteraceae bacterium]|nr:hypothetical protein [Candidatus Parcubacteria bacterium]